MPLPQVDTDDCVHWMRVRSAFRNALANNKNYLGETEIEELKKLYDNVVGYINNVCDREFFTKYPDAP